MNKQKRKQIANIIKTIQDIQSVLEDVKSDIDNLKDEEETCMNNMEDSNLQNTEKYEKISAAADELSEASDWFDDISFDDLVEHLENAAE